MQIQHITVKTITQLFKSLSDPTRVRIIWILQSGGELCVCDLMAVLDLPQSTVSRHLAYLRNAGLADDQRKGVWMYYRLPEHMDDIIAEILAVVRLAGKGSEQAALDQRRLKEYQRAKQAGTC